MPAKSDIDDIFAGDASVSVGGAKGKRKAEGQPSTSSSTAPSEAQSLKVSKKKKRKTASGLGGADAGSPADASNLESSSAAKGKKKGSVTPGKSGENVRQAETVIDPSAPRPTASTAKSTLKGTGKKKVAPVSKDEEDDLKFMDSRGKRK